MSDYIAASNICLMNTPNSMMEQFDSLEFDDLLSAPFSFPEVWNPENLAIPQPAIPQPANLAFQPWEEELLPFLHQEPNFNFTTAPNNSITTLLPVQDTMPFRPAVFSFADGDYIARDTVTLGRAPPCVHEASSGKRKREEYQSRFCPYVGGIDGPQGSSGPEGEVRLNIYPALDADGDAEHVKKMSKEHLRFEFDEAHDQWTATVKGKNGAYVGPVDGGPQDYLPQGEKILIEDSLAFDMGRVRFTMDTYGAGAYNQENLSITYDSSDNSLNGYASSSMSPQREASINSISASSSQSRASSGIRTTPATVVKPAPQRKTKVKGRGPGRPPKGDISRRIEADIKRHVKAGLIYGIDEPPPKRVINRKSKNVPETSDQDKNATEGGNEDEARGRSKKSKAQADVEEADDATAEDSAPSKPKQRERSPSPVYNKEDYKDCPEKLNKPSLTYAEMLGVVLKPLYPSGLCLQDIYREFKKNWPYFAFNNTDWQSSIRHNVQKSNNQSIESGGKDVTGKGQIWRVDPSKPIQTKQQKKDAEKKQAQAARANTAAMNGAHHHPHLPGMSYNQNASIFQQAAPGQQGIPYMHGPPYAAGPAGPMNYGPYQPKMTQQTSQGPSAAAPQASTSTSAPAIPIRGTQAPSQPAARPTGNGTVGVTGHQTTAQGTSTTGQQPRPTQNTQSQASSASQPRAKAAGPATHRNFVMSSQHMRSLKRQTFENFRKQLIRLADDEATSLRYQNLMNESINYACTHPDGAVYDGNNDDCKRIVEMLWVSWENAQLNPVNAGKAVPSLGAGQPQAKQTQAQAQTPASAAAGPSTATPSTNQGQTQASSSSQAAAQPQA